MKLAQVYLSRIPPYMKPIKITQLLGKYGELGRVYLAPEGALVGVDARVAPQYVTGIAVSHEHPVLVPQRAPTSPFLPACGRPRRPRCVQAPNQRRREQEAAIC